MPAGDRPSQVIDVMQPPQKGFRPSPQPSQNCTHLPLRLALSLALRICRTPIGSALARGPEWASVARRGDALAGLFDTAGLSRHGAQSSVAALASAVHAVPSHRRPARGCAARPSPPFRKGCGCSRASSPRCAPGSQALQWRIDRPCPFSAHAGKGHGRFRPPRGFRRAPAGPQAHLRPR